MERSKQHALMFLLGAVLVGGALGFTADRVIVHDREGAVTEQETRARFYNALALDASQRAEFDSILTGRDTEFREALAPVRPHLKEIKERARTAMRSHLTPEQKARFERFLVEQKGDTTKRR